MDFSQLKDLLFARSNFGMKLGLERMRAALALLGDPQLCAPVLHVAGSNGKGSTCAFAEASLRAAGLKTGLYTSPHLLHFCERIRVDFVPISEETAASLLEEILKKIPWALAGGPEGSSDGDGLTFFEIVTLMGFLAFARAGVQVMVIEVGLGGRLDATNLVAPLACAIAPLALEHTQHLGNTLALIAGEKAGIIKPGVPVASAGQPLAAAQVIESVASKNAAPLWRPGRDYQFESRDELPFCYRSVGMTPKNVCMPTNLEMVGAQSNLASAAWTVRVPAIDQGAEAQSRDLRSGLSLRGHHQRQNAALACALLELASRRGLAVAPEHAARGLIRARWPGRLELVARSPLLFLDGAHNPHGAQALAKALRDQLEQLFPDPNQVGARVHFVFGALAEKELRQILAPLLPLAAAMHLCAPHTPRALAAETIRAEVAALAPDLSSSVYGSAAEALSGARRAATADGVVVGCGSLYLVGELIAAVGDRAWEAMPSEQLQRRKL